MPRMLRQFLQEDGRDSQNRQCRRWQVCSGRGTQHRMTAIVGSVGGGFLGIGPPSPAVVNPNQVTKEDNAESRSIGKGKDSRFRCGS